MATDTGRFPQFIAAVAALRGEREAARVDAWQQRLSWSYSDLAALADARPAGLPIAVPEPAQPGHVAGYRPEERAEASATRIAARVRRGEQRAADVAQQSLDAAHAWRHANLFTALDADDVLSQAERIDREAGRGVDPGPLAGVPFAVKDLMPVAGYALTGGTRGRPARMADRDAPVVERLRRAGAIIFGVTNLHEVAFGVTSANPHFGTVVNPRHPERIPGGSSGGSGGVVAAGIAPLAIGTDTGGSIRIPAACCGVVGFKPSYGAVDTTDVLPLAWSLDHVGPLSATVDDAALAFEVMARLAPGTASHAFDRPPSFVLLRGFVSDVLDADVERCMGEVEAGWHRAGARVTAVAVDALRLATAAQFVTLGSEAAAANADLLSAAPGSLGEDVRTRLEMGQCFLATDYVQAQRIRRDVRDALMRALGDADVLVTPTLPCVPPPAGQSVVSVRGQAMPIAGMMTRLTSPFNMTGLPALSIPCGFDPQGLPISVQIIGRPGDDARVLAAGRWVEARLTRTASAEE